MIEANEEYVAALTRLAITWLAHWSRGTDDEGSRVWSDEDSYDVSSNGESVTVTIHRCEHSRGRCWYVPITSEEVFERELRELVDEAFR